MQAPQAELRTARAAVSATVGLLALPYLLAHPGPLADDWVFLRNGRFGGVWAAGPPQTGRIGATVLYDLTFGFIGDRPLLLQLVQVLAWLAAALSLFGVLRAFLGVRLACVTTMVWIVVPTHASLEHWASTLPALVSLALLCQGIRLAKRAQEAQEVSLLAALVLGAAVCCYETSVAVAGVAFLVLGVQARPWTKPSAGRLVVGLGIVAAPIVWSLAHPTLYRSVHGFIDPTLILPAHLSLGLAPFGPQGTAVMVVGMIGIGVAAGRLVRGLFPLVGLVAARITVAGLGVLVLGVAPLARFPTNFLGMDDRFTSTSGIGSALVWVGIALMITNVVRAVSDVPAGAVGASLAVALVAITVPLRVGQHRDFAGAAHEGRMMVAQWAAAVRPGQVVRLPGPVANVGRVYGLNDGWNATAALQAVSGLRTVVVLTGGVGPPLDDPTALFDG